MTTGTPLPDKRIPALDGLRGIAILLVLVAHLTPDVVLHPSALEWLRKIGLGGWIGVDLFFVLSGFLITGILLDAKAGSGYFRSFYGRRVLRIFPLYFAALLLIFVILPSLGFFHSAGASEVIHHQGWTWLFSTNFGMWLIGRAGFASDEIAITHFWSLAVEEHFYLLWPAIVWLTSLRRLPYWCAAGFALSLILRCIGVFALKAEPFFFVLTPCRLDGLMMGAFLATQLKTFGLLGLRRVAAYTFFGSAAGIGGALVASHGLWPTHWLVASFGLSIVSLFFGATLILALTASPSGWQSGFLSNGILRFFGRYSYAIYVIHGLLAGWFTEWLNPAAFGMLVATHPALGVFASLTARIMISAALGFLSWHLLEKHFLRLKKYFQYHGRSTTGTSSQQYDSSRPPLAAVRLTDA